MQTNFFHRGADDGPHPRPQPQYDVPVTAGELKKIFSGCDDFEARTVRIGLESRLTVTVCWLDGVVSAGDVSTDVLRPLTEGARLADINSTREAVHRIEQGAVYSCSTRTRAEMDDVVSDLTNGSAALVFDAQRKAITFEVRTSNVRAVSEPTIEKSVSGSKDAFVETLRINTSLVRRKLHTPALKLQQTVVGRQSETTVAVLYVDGIADPARVQRILDKLDTIDEQALLGRGDLEPYLTQRPRALLPQLGQTERPDKFAGALLVGQSAVDAKVVSPVAIIVVALAGIAGYTLPNQELSNAVRLLRLGLVLAAALAGLFGILAMLGLVIWYLCTIDSDGVAYMAPFVDSERPTIFRTLLRRPQPDEKFRPPEYGSPNRRRQR